MKKLIITILLLSTSLFGAKKPNIIFILADDLGMGDLSCYGQEKLQTPNIDRIAKEGMQFDRHYSGSTVCAPSRCTLMTGMHTGNSIIRGNSKVTVKGFKGDMYMPEDTLTVAKFLKDNGYKTGLFGKWGLGANVSISAPLKMGFDKFFGYDDQALAHNYFPEYLCSDDGKITYEGNSVTSKKFYSPDMIHNEAMKFIDDNKDKPFFLYYASTLPHASIVSIEKYQAQFRGKFDPEVKFNGGHYTKQPETHAAFAAMIFALDSYVGDVFKKLEAEGILDNTIIIFSSDNGTHVEGGHNPKYWNSSASLRGNKRDMYEGGVRTPMLVYWKNKVQAGSKTSHISAFWDFLPTVADVIGVEAPKGLDGISYLPTLLGNAEQKEHNYLYWEFKEKGGKKAILQGDWKLVALNVTTKAIYELYNIADDRPEQKNLINTNPEKFQELKELLDKARSTPKIPAFEFGGEK
ncbi:MAG: arylsulfatase [Opitutales bacterium]